MPNERRYSNELNLESVGINLPYNMQAEQSVLGAVLLKPDTLTDLQGMLQPSLRYFDRKVLSCRPLLHQSSQT